MSVTRTIHDILKMTNIGTVTAMRSQTSVPGEAAASDLARSAAGLRRSLAVFGFVLAMIASPVRPVAQTDTSSARILDFPAFMDLVRAYHPVARQANLVVDRARAEMVAARAGFDPFFYLGSERKTFDGKFYYDHFNPELRIPTWFGIEVATGLEDNLGDFLNPEVTSGRSSYLGVSVPLARNLLMDRRRAVLQQARIFREQSKAERTLILNDLLFDAGVRYWEWVRSYMVYAVLSDAVAVNRQRLAFVKVAAAQGERPAIDTTEALAQLQFFQLASNEAWLDFRKAGLELSNDLWRDDASPYYLPANVRPDTAWIRPDLRTKPLPILEELLASAATAHPKLQTFDFKMQSLEIERRLKFQELLPYVNLKYNVLNSGYNVFDGASAAFYRNNYKFGIDIGVPLRLSQGRGNYAAAKIKISETDLQRSQTRLAIENKVRYHFSELALLQDQAVTAEDNLRNYLRLLRGEETRFRAGESSLFMVNTRENSVLQSRQKYIDVMTKSKVSELALQWAAGQLR